jgi:hypothetical protein
MAHIKVLQEPPKCHFRGAVCESQTAFNNQRKRLSVLMSEKFMQIKKIPTFQQGFGSGLLLLFGFSPGTYDPKH